MILFLIFSFKKKCWLSNIKLLQNVDRSNFTQKKLKLQGGVYRELLVMLRQIYYHRSRKVKKPASAKTQIERKNKKNGEH